MKFGLALGSLLAGAAIACTRSAPIRGDEAPIRPVVCAPLEPRALPPHGTATVRDLSWSVDGLVVLFEEGARRRVVLVDEDGTIRGALDVEGQRFQALPERRIAVLGRGAVIVDLARRCHRSMRALQADDEVVTIDWVRDAALVSRASVLEWRPLAGPSLPATRPPFARSVSADRRGGTFVLVHEFGAELRVPETFELRAKDEHGWRVLASALSPRGDRLALAEELWAPGRTRRVPEGTGPHEIPPARHAIHVVDGDGREVALVEQPARHVSWSSDGGTLAFAGAVIGRLRGETVTVFEAGAWSWGPIAWAPDDASFAVARAGSVEIRRSDGALLRRIPERSR
jgi:hypothetical protein